MTAAAADPPDSGLERAVADHLEWLRVHGYATTTVANRERYLAALVDYLTELGVTDPAQVSLAALESYQRHLYRHRTRDGRPLAFRTQAQRLIPVKVLFGWLTQQARIPYDPSLGLVLPKAERRLPESTLSADEAEAVLAGPDVTSLLGVRDRTILEVLYSTAIRRNELIGLQVWDIDHTRRTVFIRHGKGGKDRHVPIGARALGWITHYTHTVRPRLATSPDPGVLFLTAGGGRLCPDWLSRTVTAYIAAGAPGKHGSCHLFRHTAATLMLDAGADIRYVGEMLGHAKLETTQLYTHVSIAKLRAVHAATHPTGDASSGAAADRLRVI